MKVQLGDYKKVILAIANAVFSLYMFFEIDPDMGVFYPIVSVAVALHLSLRLLRKRFLL